MQRAEKQTDYVYTTTGFSEISEKKADKIILEVSSLADMRKYERILPEELYIQLSENKIGMIMRKEATKSKGAFGDDYNDIDMLQFCGTGVCVKNAVDAAKEAADEVCDTNENDGVAKWIVKNVLLN